MKLNNRKLQVSGFLIPLTVLLTLFSQQLPGQACVARAGKVNLVAGPDCATGSFTVSVTGPLVAPTHTNVFLLTDLSGNFIDVTNTTGVFSGLPYGGYTVFHLNYLTSAPPGNLPQPGSNISELTASESGCYDLSAALPVVIEDALPPVALCTPDTILVFLDETGSFAPAPGDFDFGSTDNCGPPSLSVRPAVLTCDQPGYQDVVLVATDGAGRRDSCTTTVLVRDTLAPVLQCREYKAFIDPSGIATIVLDSVVATLADNCGIDQATLDRSAFTCAESGVQSIVVTATDQAGNRATCNAKVTVVDTIPPQVSCRDTLLYLDLTGTATLDPVLFGEGSTDNCGVKTYFLNKRVFTCADLGSQIARLLVVDNSNLGKFCLATVEVRDTFPPTAQCTPQVIYLNAAGQAAVDPVAFSAGSRDNCGIDTAWTSRQDFSCQDLGTHSVDLWIRDMDGRTATCNGIVEVRDTLRPQARCQTTTVFLGDNGIARLSPAMINAGSSDNCGALNLSVDRQQFNCGDEGQQVVRLFAEDGSGNRDSCQITISVLDRQPPALVCRDSMTIFLPPGGLLVIDPAEVVQSVTDNCGLAVNSLNSSRIDCSNVGVSPVTFTALDRRGNRGSCVVQVRVRDTIPPQAVCRDTILYLNEAGLAATSAALVGAGSQDNCGLAGMELDRTVFDCSSLGGQQVTLTVIDKDQNRASCTATVTVRDTTPPLTGCRDTEVFLDANGEARLVASNIDAGSTDNCGMISSLSISRAAFTCADLGVQTVRLTARDGSGNQRHCFSMVTVSDTLAPQVQCRPLTVYLDAAGAASWQPADLHAGSSDNCAGVLSLSADVLSANCETPVLSFVTLTAEDASGNRGFCQAALTVLDTVSPVARCRDTVIFLDAGGVATLAPAWINAGSSDNCADPVDLSLDRSTFDCLELGVRNVILTVRDGAGNAATCTALVTVNDTIGPKATCFDATVYLDADGQAGLDPRELINGGSDNCGQIGSVWAEKTAFTCTDRGSNALWLFYEDPNRNTDSCRVTIIVRDTLAPEASCRDFVLELGINGNAVLTPDLINVQSTDNCGISRLEVSTRTFSCADLGPNTVWLVATDAAGNRDSCSATVEVVDRNLPFMATRNIIVYLDEQGRAEIHAADLDGGTTDNCDIDSFLVDRRVFGCADLGENIVILTAVDVDGNRNTKAAVVTVADTTAPRLACPKPLELSTAEDGISDCQSILLDGRLDPFVTDNCATTSLRHNIAGAPAANTLKGAAFPVGTTLIRWTASDLSGNAAACEVRVTVRDNEAPTAKCREELMLQLDADGTATLEPSLVDAGSHDNCGTFTFELDRTAFDCEDVGFHQVTATLIDGAGNRSECQVKVGIVSSAACPMPNYSNAGGVSISDPCSCRGNGEFDEEVVIGPTAPGQVWTVKFTTLLDEQTMLPFPPGTPFVEMPQSPSASIYVLAGIHLDGQGYTMEAESPNFSGTLMISNTCYYPDPQILGLPDRICLMDSPVNLVGTVGGNVQGVGSFTINGQPATVLDPQQLGAGVHTVAFSFDAGDPAGANLPNDVGCVETVYQQVEVVGSSPYFACNDQVTIPMNDACEVLVKPEMLLGGNLLCFDDYVVFLSYDNQPVPNPVPAFYAGKTLQAVVQHTPSDRYCSSTVRLIDLTGPRITSCPANISDRFICTDLDSIFNNPSSIDPAGRLFTGVPVVADNCGQTFLTFTDELLQVGNCLAGAVFTLRRTFRVRDQFGNLSTCQQLIYFHRPDTVYFPADTLVRSDCRLPAPLTNAQGNLHPQLSGYPYVLNGFGDTVLLDPNGELCGLTMFYEDQRFDQCSDRYTVERSWRVWNTCSNQPLGEARQVIRYGDYDAPLLTPLQLDLDNNGLPDDTLVYSTTGFDCTATFTLPKPGVEDCSEVTLHTRIFTNAVRSFPYFDTVFQELEQAVLEGDRVSNVPVGTHFLLFSAMDACGNTSAHTVLVRVEDRVAPTVFCDDDLTLVLDNTGNGRIFATDVDEGSRDNCDGRNVRLEIRRLISGDCAGQAESFYTEWGAFTQANCCDVGKTVIVELRVTDSKGNSNVCVSRIKVEDKLRPTCTPPPNLTVNCTDLPGDFDPANTTFLQAAFGTPTASDNCGAYWEELTPDVSVNQCGYGTVVRTFRAVDNAGNLSWNLCVQKIEIKAIHNYQIKFPKDAIVYCGAPEADTLEYRSAGCDLLAVSTEERRFNVSASGCYQITREYQVINWCEYDGISGPVTISRDADCDLNPGDEDVWLLVRANGTVYLDRDSLPFNGLPAAGVKGASCDGTTNPSGHWQNSTQTTALRSVGYWRYTQFLTVVDTSSPKVVFSVPEPFCSDRDDCEGFVRYPITINEVCSPEAVTLAVRFDEGADGTIDRTVPLSQIRGNYPELRIEGFFPLGTHRFEVEVNDGCGNKGVYALPLEVIDCKAPELVCINGFSVALSPLEPAVDADGDGDIDLAAAEVRAKDYVAKIPYDCSGPVVYSINRQGETPNRDQATLILACDEATPIVMVEIHAWDQAGNKSTCVSYIEVQNNANACVQIPEGSIVGMVATEMGDRVNQVMVRLSGSQDVMQMTKMDGLYNFEELEEDKDYTVTPYLNDGVQNGVSTFDLVLIRRHILGIRLLDSPYKMIAADVNNSKGISTLDLVLLQKVILGIDAGFRDNNSWRFVDMEYDFPKPEHPWWQVFPEFININNLAGNIYGANFVGVKIGDVNNTVNPAGVTSLEIRSAAQPLTLRLPDRALRAGQRYRIPVYAGDPERTEGYQFTLGWDDRLLAMDPPESGRAGPAHFAYFPEERSITGNWYEGMQGLNTEADVLFYLAFTARQDGRLSDALRLNSRITPTEAYTVDGELADLELEFTGLEPAPQQMEVMGLYPNPFRESVSLELAMPEAGTVRFLLQGSDGRLLREWVADLPAGTSRQNLSGTGWPTGVLYLTVQSGAWVETRRMVRMPD